MNKSLFGLVNLLIFDFDGVFTDNTVIVNQDGVESVSCWRSDGLGLSRVKGCGLQVVIVSSEKNHVVTARAAKLGVPCYSGVENKEQVVRKICNDLNIPLENTLFAGNDINDIPALKIVGLPVAVADAYPEILEHVLYITNKPGGFGAVREICDYVYFERALNNAS
jgi:3-deoxy-D-manno-octulosonate 8-phosphate phosphatase (KDO 8-P phosphatase)